MSCSQEDLADRLRGQTCAGHPGSELTSGLVAYAEGEPVGWCAVQPRTAYRAVEHARIGGARVLEGYPLTTGSAVSEELHPGVLSTFLDAGFLEVYRPSARRAVVAIKF